MISFSQILAPFTFFLKKRLGFFRILFFLILVSLQSILIAGPTEDVQTARQLFEKGQSKSAAKILIQVLKKYPQNQAASYLLARIYYRNGKSRIAYRFFRRSGLAYADDEGTLEYGLTMFTYGSCREAHQAFAKVENSGRRGIADFYDGVCSMRMRNYVAAEYQLRHAQPLPPQLESRRQSLLYEIAARQRADVHDLRNTNSHSSPSVPAINPVPKMGAGASFSPTLEYVSYSDTWENHGTTNNAKNQQGPKASGALSLFYRFKPDHQNRQPEIKLGLSGGVRNLKSQSQSVTYVDANTATGDIFPERTNTSTSDRAAQYEAKPELVLPIANILEINLLYKYGEELPDYLPDQKSSYSGPQGSLGLSMGTVSNIKLSGYMLDKVGVTGGNLTSTRDLNGRGDLSFNLPATSSLNFFGEMTNTSDPSYSSLNGFTQITKFGAGIKKNWEIISFGLTASQVENAQPSDKPVTGTESSTHIASDLSIGLKLGLTVSGSVEYAQIGAYTQTDLCPTDSSGTISKCGDDAKKNAHASGSATDISGKIKFAPLEWVYASTQYEIIQTKYSVNEPELTEDFQEHAVDFSTSLSVIVGVTTTL